MGAGELKEEIKAKVNQLGLINVVTFMGSRADVQDFYQAFDVFVFPSLYEGLGVVAIEAQCSGLPCVMSDIIPKEAFICNATAVSLHRSPQEWAKVICEKIKNFERKDEAEVIRQAGFDAKEVGQFIQDEYLK